MYRAILENLPTKYKSVGGRGWLNENHIRSTPVLWDGKGIAATEVAAMIDAISY